MRKSAYVRQRNEASAVVKLLLQICQRVRSELQYDGIGLFALSIAFDDIWVVFQPVITAVELHSHVLIELVFHNFRIYK